MKTLSEDILTATVFALVKHDPSLALELKKKIESTGSVELPEMRLGASIYAKITFEPSDTLPTRVAAALRSIESREGAASTYGGRQLNFLRMNWER